MSILYRNVRFVLFRKNSFNDVNSGLNFVKREQSFTFFAAKKLLQEKLFYSDLFKLDMYVQLNSLQSFVTIFRTSAPIQQQTRTVLVKNIYMTAHGIQGSQFINILKFSMCTEYLFLSQ